MPGYLVCLSVFVTQTNSERSSSEKYKPEHLKEWMIRSDRWTLAPGNITAAKQAQLLIFVFPNSIDMWFLCRLCRSPPSSPWTSWSPAFPTSSCETPITPSTNRASVPTPRRTASVCVWSDQPRCSQTFLNTNTNTKSRLNSKPWVYLWVLPSDKNEVNGIFQIQSLQIKYPQFNGAVKDADIGKDADTQIQYILAGWR